MSVQDFDGNWVNVDRNETHTIGGGVLSWWNGTTSPLRLDAPGTISVQSASGNFTGQLANGGSQIVWNNGARWSRNGQQQNASPPASAPMVQAAPMQQQPPPTFPSMPSAPQPQQYAAPPPSSPWLEAVPQSQNFQPPPAPMQYTQPAPQPQPLYSSPPPSAPAVQAVPPPQPVPMQYAQPLPQPPSQPVPQSAPAPQPMQYSQPPPQAAPQPPPVQYMQPAPQPAPQPVQYTQPAPQQYAQPAPQPVAAPQPAPQPVQYTQPAPVPQPVPQPAQYTQPAPAPQPAQYMQPAPQTVAAPQPAPQPVQYTQPPPQPAPQPQQYMQPAPAPQPAQFTPPAFQPALQPTPSTVAPVQYTQPAFQASPPQQPLPVQSSSPPPSQWNVPAAPPTYASMPAPATQYMPAPDALSQSWQSMPAAPPQPAPAYQAAPSMPAPTTQYMPMPAPDTLSQSWQSLPAAPPPQPAPVYQAPPPQIMPQYSSPPATQQSVQSIPMPQPMQYSSPPPSQQTAPAVPAWQSMPAPPQPIQYSSPPATQQSVQAAPAYASMPAPTYSPPASQAFLGAPPPTTITSMPQSYGAPPPQSYMNAPAPSPAELPPTSYAASQYAGAGPPQTPKGLLDRDRLLQLKQIFLKYDTDGSNMLGIDELGRVLDEINMPVGPQGLHMFYENFDVSPDGRISFAEFMAAFHSPKPDYDPPMVAPVAAADGKFVDVQFPPNDNSVWLSTNPVADKVDIARQACGGAVQWVRANDLCQGAPLFENVHPNDIAQSVLGDCWLLGALAGLAEFEGAVFGLFEERRQSPDGRYTMRIYNGAEFEPVVIDDFIPVSAVDGQTLFSKPQDNDQWVLLAEKAMAKWMGSYVQCTSAYNLVAFMLLTDSGPCKAFGQSRNGQPPFDSNNFTEMRVTLTDPHKRGSVILEERGPASPEGVWQELLTADRMNYLMCAWTLKEVGPVGTNGLVRGKAYAIIGALEVPADGITWRVVHVRNPWAVVPGAEWRGQLSEEWAGWGQYPQLAQELGIGNAGLDGTFWMTWDDFRDAFSDVGIVPKTMEVPRLGQVECEAPIPAPNARHGKRFQH